MSFVVDASATLPWCFEDEAAAWTEGLLDELGSGGQAFAPAHWPVEVCNGLLMAVRRKRIAASRAEWFMERLASLPILVEAPLSVTQRIDVFTLCTRHGLTFYDGSCLELAIRLRLPLATFDAALVRAAPLESVPLRQSSRPKVRLLFDVG